MGTERTKNSKLSDVELVGSPQCNRDDALVVAWAWMENQHLPVPAIWKERIVELLADFYLFLARDWKRVKRDGNC